MDQKMKGSSKVPMFEGNDYAFQSVRMKNYLMSLRPDVWALVVRGYDVREDYEAMMFQKIFPQIQKRRNNIGIMQKL